MLGATSPDGTTIDVYRQYPIIAGYVQIPQVLIKNRNRITLTEVLDEYPDAEVFKLDNRCNSYVRIPLSAIDPDGTLGL
mgnify:FL=1